MTQTLNMPFSLPDALRQTSSGIAYKFAIEDGNQNIFHLGCCSGRVTIASQQQRAINLVWALNELGLLEGKRILVIGAGFAGLMFAALCKTIAPSAILQMFDSSGEGLHLQRNNVTRFIQPNIYDWPSPTARYPRTQFPLLNWVSGSAGAVVDDVLRQWERLGIQVQRRRAKYIRSGIPAVVVWDDENDGHEQSADIVVIAVGFGLEKGVLARSSVSYWSNDPLNQSHLGLAQKARILISGKGDGGLIDAIRAKIVDFDHAQFTWKLTDSNLYEKLLESGNKAIENSLDWHQIEFDANLLQFLDGVTRRDTEVILNAKSDWFLSKNSALFNRIILAMLFKNGEIEIQQGTILEDEIVREGISGRLRVPIQLDKNCRTELDVHHLILRHGTIQQCKVLFENETVWQNTLNKWLREKEDPRSDISSSTHYPRHFLIDKCMANRGEVEFEIAYLFRNESEAQEQLDLLKRFTDGLKAFSFSILNLSEADFLIPQQRGAALPPYWAMTDSRFRFLILRSKQRSSFLSLFDCASAIPYYSYGVKVLENFFCDPQQQIEQSKVDKLPMAKKENGLPERDPFVPILFPGHAVQLVFRAQPDQQEGNKVYFWFRIIQTSEDDGHRLRDAHNMLSVREMTSIVRNEWTLKRMEIVGKRMCKSFEDNLESLSYF